ncbi:serine protein kinase RIO [Nanohaloarchaea archaeon H01]|nr:serine protein kinase RIO [Nanohaloarchaea archaeon H01]
MKDEERDWRERWREQSRQMFDTSEAEKAFQNVFDHETSMALLKLYNNQVLDTIYGVIESGKESVIFLADTPEGERVVLKIYMTRAGNFREMKNYLRGDKRFRNVKDDRRSVIQEWCKKEYRNLKKAEKHVNCPKPIAVRKNILVMEFIGEHFSPYPKMKDVEPENPQEAYEDTLDAIERLWMNAELVHGDLSEYNILVDGEGRKLWIDFSQGVHIDHPLAEELLRRDIENVANFFRKHSADTNVQKAFESVISS